MCRQPGGKSFLQIGAAGHLTVFQQQQAVANPENEWHIVFDDKDRDAFCGNFLQSVAKILPLQLVQSGCGLVKSNMVGVETAARPISTIRLNPDDNWATRPPQTFGNNSHRAEGGKCGITTEPIAPQIRWKPKKRRNQSTLFAADQTNLDVLNRRQLIDQLRYLKGSTNSSARVHPPARR